MASTRRLAAILAADVAGYSRLMGADEEGTHERLRAHLHELVEPKIKEHRHRIDRSRSGNQPELCSWLGDKRDFKALGRATRTRDRPF